MPQLITDVFGAESLGNQQRSKEVPQVMETEFFEAGTFFDLRKSSGFPLLSGKSSPDRHEFPLFRRALIDAVPVV